MLTIKNLLFTQIKVAEMLILACYRSKVAFENLWLGFWGESLAVSLFKVFADNCHLISAIMIAQHLSTI